MRLHPGHHSNFKMLTMITMQLNFELIVLDYVEMYSSKFSHQYCNLYRSLASRVDFFLLYRSKRHLPCWLREVLQYKYLQLIIEIHCKYSRRSYDLNLSTDISKFTQVIPGINLRFTAPGRLYVYCYRKLFLL